MSKIVEFYFDVGSPASYLAYTQLPSICAESGAELIYRPILLGGVFKATGNASPNEVPAKARYSINDLDRCAKRYGVPLLVNPHFPINTLHLMRAITGAQSQRSDRFIEFVDMTFRAMWVQGRNLNDPEVLNETLKEAGFDPAQVFAWVNDPSVKDRLKSETEAAVARGIFGAPSMFVGSALYFGQDRLDFVREALTV
ncbi:2-hydroxychromene-2-carboxylate isomerase [Pseudomonas sp. LS-2]|jgi:2-hydroxychromene-2-carboxylate isomerase|uniref:2-hydroxychromene-2-carboxylate isomerase n=1 Tax=Pseudomonas sp. LS-2 TaxID=2315859 RepID=UPI000E75A4DF|nr:2-hydroxychromene-2-carboxylate isomerase [Pseudomonas sp. LS-2]RJX82754.1 2-hydroxychromene-2-carboxylate isomerase [Pseudomonas sp. LS-2]